LVVHCNHMPILHRYGDMEPQRLLGHDLDLLGSRDVFGHVTIRFPYGVSYSWSMVTIRLSYTVSDIYSLKDIAVTTLTFQGRVTSSVT